MPKTVEHVIKFHNEESERWTHNGIYGIYAGKMLLWVCQSKDMKKSVGRYDRLIRNPDGVQVKEGDYETTSIKEQHSFEIANQLQVSGVEFVARILIDLDDLDHLKDMENKDISPLTQDQIMVAKWAVATVLRPVLNIQGVVTNFRVRNDDEEATGGPVDQ